MSTGLVTIFGGSGYIGRHLVGRLASRGYQVRIAVRDTEKAAPTMTQGNVGQVVAAQANIRNLDSVKRAVAGADVVINLVGLLYETGAQTFEAVHREGAINVVSAASEAGANRVIQMSSMGVDGKSESVYSRTKAQAEEAIRDINPDVTILRPSVVFGADDDFTNKFGSMATMMLVLPLLNGGANKLQPLWVEDLVDAIVAVIENAETKGQTYELGGPEALSFADVISRINEVTGRNMFVAPLPEFAMKTMAFFMGLVPGKPMLTVEQVRMSKNDNVASGELPGFEALGITPTGMSKTSLEYLKRFRKGGGLSEKHA